MSYNYNKPGFSRGFLFTIAVILFASTLVIFAQSYANVNFSEERSVILAAKPANVLLLGDDLAFDVLSLLRMNIDVNKSYPNEVQFSGDFLSSRDISAEFSNYSTFLSTIFFSRSLGSESLDLSNMEGSKGELFFGNSVQLDYNYSNNIFLFPYSTSLQLLDINLTLPGTVSSISWSPSVGVVPITINYQDDYNRYSVSSSISRSALSSLQINYADANVFVYLGGVTLNGYTKNSAMAIVPWQGEKIRYSVKAKYSSEEVLLPVKANALLSINRDSVDSNTFIILQR